MRKIIYIFMFLSLGMKAQNIYSVDITNPVPPIVSNHIKQGSHIAPNGSSLTLNSFYFIKNDKPWYPVMGEFHFSRYPKSEWEDSILKMKAAGIDVIASYVFWIYHEEKEGVFNWEKDNDLNAFLALCKKHDMFFYARIGPWCHGEVRNGGLPDWIIKKGNSRSNDVEYLASVQKFYNQIGDQCKGMYFKDGGPIIGTQIENEYRFNNPKGLKHILTLKEMAVKSGIDVPYYSATGWPGSNLKQLELVPVWGAYPEAPWSGKTTQLDLSENYLFGTLRNDPSIGSDLFKQDDIEDYKGYRYPYATAEMGGGNQVTYHRRPIIKSEDVTALAYTKIGSGANLMGYYMFHGGSNKIGRFSTLQESKATKYANDYPIISYDFQSPIGEFGVLRPSLNNFKLIHTFLNEFGDRLAACGTYFPDMMPTNEADANTLRFGVRAKENSGFVFVSHFQRQLQMNPVKEVQFKLKLKDGKEFVFPKKPITVDNNTQAVLPFNMDLEGVNLSYATAQPLYKINGDIPLFVFFEIDGIQPEFVFDKQEIKKAKVTNGTKNISNEDYTFSTLQTGLDCMIEIQTKKGKKVRVLTLTKEQAKYAYKLTKGNSQKLLVANQVLLVSGNEVKAIGNKVLNIYVYPKKSKIVSDEKWIRTKEDTKLFCSYATVLKGEEEMLSFTEIEDLSAYFNNSEKLPMDDRKKSVSQSNPGPQYQTNLSAVIGAHNYLLELPNDINSLSILTFDYYGDTAALYIDGKLVADDFYYGNPWRVGFNDLSKKVENKKVVLQIVPLTKERNIYFESGVREQIETHQNKALQSIKMYNRDNVKFTIK